MKDYSQYGEQGVILKYFEEHPDARRRCVLEIGAWDPIIFSSSRALIESGWSAVLIEPSPVPLANLSKEYAGSTLVRVLAAAVTPETGGPGFVQMQVSDDGISSTEPEHVEKWREAAPNGYRGTLLVPTVTLEQISNWFGGFDFVSIDTEGTSVDVFLRLLALGWKPDCLMVEHDGRSVEAISAAMKHGYRLLLANECNLVFGL